MLKEILVALAMVSLIAACGNSTTEKNETVPPAANDPKNGPTTPLDPSDPKVDPRVPSWVSHASPVILPFANDYSLFATLLNTTIVTPVVGDPIAALEIKNTAGTSVSGKLFIGIEDAAKFIWDERAAVWGYKDGSFFDGIFPTTANTMRVIWEGANSSGVRYWSIYYRARQSGEVQCYTKTETICAEWKYYTDYGWACIRTTTQTSFDVDACKSYMNTSNVQVEKLGSFVTDYSKILVN